MKVQRENPVSEAEAIESVQPLVFTVARYWKGNESEIAQEINQKLLIAYRRNFDPSVASWCTYAGCRIPRMGIDAARTLKLIYRNIGGVRKQPLVIGSIETLADGHPWDPVDAWSDVDDVDFNDALDAMADDKHLRFFALTIRHRTMSAAGESAGVSESRVSQAIRDIRDNPCLKKRLAYLLGIEYRETA